MKRESTSDYMNRLVREQRANPNVLHERMNQDFARILGVPAIPADIATPRDPVSQTEEE